jgi:hypothetical protein
VLPLKAPPLQRENRLYQADWLLRFYGFTPEEVANSGENGMLRWMSIPSRPGRSKTAGVFRSTSIRPTARRCYAYRASVPDQSTASSPPAATPG